MENRVSSEIPSSVSINGVSADSVESLHTQEFEENKKFQAKMARASRKMRMDDKKTNSSITSSSTFSSQSSSGGSSPNPEKKKSSERNEDHNVIYTPNDHVKLRIVLKKVLSCTDVGEKGRIILPKREVEGNLPNLASNNGVDIVIKEVSSDAEWKMILRYWANNKGNMYVFDKCGDFIKENLMEAGDELNVYKDDQRNLYFTIRKKAERTGQSYNYNSVSLETTEEEESNLRILMEELKDKEEEEPNTLTTLYNNGGCLADGN